MHNANCYIYIHTHTHACMCVSSMYRLLLHAFQMCLRSWWLYITNYICWDCQRKKMSFCLYVLENSNVLENSVSQQILPYFSRDIYVIGVMKAWQSTLKYRTKLEFTCMYIITLSLTSSKQVLLIRFFYSFCDFFHGQRLYNFRVHFKNYIFTKWSHYLYLQYSKFWRWLKATLSNVKKSFFNQIKIIFWLHAIYGWPSTFMLNHYFDMNSKGFHLHFPNIFTSTSFIHSLAF